MSNEDIMFFRWLMLEKKIDNNELINCSEDIMNKLKEEYGNSSYTK